MPFLGNDKDNQIDNDMSEVRLKIFPWCLKQYLIYKSEKYSMPVESSGISLVCVLSQVSP